MRLRLENVAVKRFSLFNGHVSVSRALSDHAYITPGDSSLWAVFFNGIRDFNKGKPVILRSLLVKRQKTKLLTG